MLQIPRQIGLVLPTCCQAQHLQGWGFGEDRQGTVGLGSVLQAGFALRPRTYAQDGAYPPLANGTKAVDLLAEDGKPRSVLLAWQSRFDHENNLRSCSLAGMRCAKATLCTGTSFLGFTTGCLQSISRLSARNSSRDQCCNRGAPVFSTGSVSHCSNT